jgi:trehalose/maltose hydrolase-like predicted phosphorylase
MVFGGVVAVRCLRWVSLHDRALAGQIVLLEANQAVAIRLETVPGSAPCGLEVQEIQRTSDGLAWKTTPGQRARFCRGVAFSRGAPAVPRVDRRALALHLRAWRQRWRASEVVVEGDEDAQEALRFAIYHLTSAANPEDNRMSVGARGLTGDGYMGHVFWDTEVFMLPFYTLTWPAAARAMLAYRIRTLPQALAKAAAQGYQGALYAWESADTGEETTPRWVTDARHRRVKIWSGLQEHHISADVAHAVWRYWQATGDDPFLLEGGGEIILQTSRFWASRAVEERDGRYHIRHVMGPDEYHDDVDDNAYTNVMARVNLARGLAVANWFRTRHPEAWKTLEFSDTERRHWAEVAELLVTGWDRASGRFEQFEGYSRLEDVDLAAYGDARAPMDVVLGAAGVRRTRISKQADVVMLMALLDDHFDAGVQAVNFDYYLPRCGHGSSLSPSVHALVAARLGRLNQALAFFRQTTAIDLNPLLGNSAAGIHMAALGGLWQSATLGFAGLRVDAAGVRVDPHLPWRRLAFPCMWRGRSLHLDLRPGVVTFRVEAGNPVPCQVGALRRRVEAGTVWRCTQRGDRSWREVSI